MNKGALKIIRHSKAQAVTRSFLVHLLQFGTRKPHICISEYDLANCLTDLGLVQTEVRRLINTATISGSAKTDDISFSRRQVHKYWSTP